MKYPTVTEKERMLNIIQEAREAGKKAAEIKYLELLNAGPKYEVFESDLTDKPIPGGGRWKLLDLCGFATINVRMHGRDPRWQALKALDLDRENRIMVHDKYSGMPKSLAIFDMTMRQEISVNEAADNAAAEVLKAHGIECWVTTRLD